MSEFDKELRAALGSIEETDFDYDALVAGTKTRARRIRRRRAVTQGVTAAILVPTLVASGWAIGKGLGGSGLEAPDMAGTTATSTAEVPDDTAGDTADRTADDTVRETVEATGAPEQGTTDDSAADPSLPPYQQVAPPAPLDPGDPGGSVYANEIEIPDARPTGIPFLDDLGAPQYRSDYPRKVPLMDFMLATGDEVKDVRTEPHSATEWFYFDGTNAIDQPTVSIVITAWDSGADAMAAFREGGRSDYASSFGDLEPAADGTDEPTFVHRAPEPLPWAGHDGDEDYLLVGRQGTPAGSTAGALVRQSDYLVGVAVNDASYERALEAAGQIAEQTAANLAHLDPARAGAGR
ncbi:hypothetical protein [Ornithinimicrobium panacihumi]|uniref:hypothetical protein n=1 Tax=Ornithinimicrobium panacihumi TaxID=2008449 RepID=UPI003F8B0675